MLNPLRTHFHTHCAKTPLILSFVASHSFAMTLKAIFPPLPGCTATLCQKKNRKRRN
ncbi:hypothetical protein K438DRAFT_1799971 [Mycena galopus ATCC 62051]|nr:hypothetical protein K438DRAFT_1799971 [Mycena galopus ATCC 62051]